MKPIMRASAVLSIFIVTALLSRCGGGSKQSSPPLTITTASLPNDNSVFAVIRKLQYRSRHSNRCVRQTLTLISPSARPASTLASLLSS
jgi:hypothetical protein